MVAYDKIIIGAGIYGMYAALFSAKKGDKVLLLEYDDEPFMRATYINQARVHNGYHYPRSYSTAIKSAKYFDRFNDDFSFAINKDFLKIYATAANFSWTNANQFQTFCKNAAIDCDLMFGDSYFKPNMCDGVFKTTEYTFDAMLIKQHFIDELAKFSNVTIKYKARIKQIIKNPTTFSIILQNNEIFETPYLLNATYASTNQINSLLQLEPFKIKYEICEIILCKVSDLIKDVGITVMDGPFFSLMPFGKTPYHSLTTVTFTPHTTSHSNLPTFSCQKSIPSCTPSQLDNCNQCKAKPSTGWNFMSTLARKYLKDDITIDYVKSLYSIKPILMTSEIDDSRPTVIRKFYDDPIYISILSGKINTVYDLDEVL